MVGRARFAPNHFAGRAFLGQRFDKIGFDRRGVDPDTVHLGDVGGAPPIAGGLLARLADDFGVRSAWSAANPGSRLPQTLRWARDPRPPYHCDGIFLPSEWCHRITSVQVLDGSPWTELSDHNPIVADIET